MSQPAAAILDIDMLHRLGVAIASEIVAEDDLPLVLDAEHELGRRMLIKYVRKENEHYYSSLASVADYPGPHWLTPTPLHPSEVESALNLPPLKRPTRALLLRPERLVGLRGPRRIAAGQTVEYVCDSFGPDAFCDPGWGIKL